MGCTGVAFAGAFWFRRIPLGQSHRLRQSNILVRWIASPYRLPGTFLRFRRAPRERCPWDVPMDKLVNANMLIRLR